MLVLGQQAESGFAASADVASVLDDGRTGARKCCSSSATFLEL